MSLQPEQINLISFIDQKVKDIISSGGNEISVMISLLDEMPRVKTIIDSVNKEELNKYCDSHDGFYQYMKILENTAGAIASGSIKVPR
ncbi:hypothetical protein Trichorick_01511 (plasmid) [Candidatus Trichorickettsia mobilis]|uniref:hypothetical protein n=1 Tax=Candidatus Trichorickettsia mobilis TaxID=1346319 RepID=UPI002B25A079|nr:hypothetical protein [Candidatus Trichorickettsia mobilis]WPY01597.1 hypothetical protein Trichorick_01511 [Candidatus Trichorickettsia mobilis]